MSIKTLKKKEKKSSKALIRYNHAYSSVSPEMKKKEGWIIRELHSKVWNPKPQTTNLDVDPKHRHLKIMVLLL